MDSTGLTTVISIGVDGLVRCNQPECARTFGTAGRLRRHSKTHSKPYRCETCDQGFALRTDLHRHHTKHRKVSVLFHCKIPGCSVFKGTMRKDNLKRHMRTCHADEELQDDKISALFSQAQRERKKKMETSHLLLAAQSGNQLLLQSLIDHHGAYIATTDDHGKTPLHVAASKGYEGCVRLLLDRGADPVLMDNDGNSPLHDAARSGDARTTQLLIDHGAPISLPNRPQRRALDLAAQEGNLATARTLLRNNADINARSSGLNPTALHIATSKGCERMTNLLVHHGAALDAKDVDSETPLFRAAQSGHTRLLTLLIPEYLRQSKFDFTCTKDPASVVAVGACDEATAQLLIDHGLDVNGTHPQWRTALRRAVVHDNEPLVRLLIEQGATLSEAERDKQSDLQVALTRGHTNVAKIVLEGGADPGRTECRAALRPATDRGNRSTVMLLLDEIDPMGYAAEYSAALAFAASQGHEDMTRVLLEKVADLTSVQSL